MMCQVGIARQFWFVSKETRLLGFFLFHSTQCNLIYCGSHVESVYVPLATQPHMITGSLSWLLEKTFREFSMLPPDKEKRGACWSWLCSQVAGKSTLQINGCFKNSTHKLLFLCLRWLLIGEGLGKQYSHTPICRLEQTLRQKNLVYQ